MMVEEERDDPPEFRNHWHILAWGNINIKSNKNLNDKINLTNKEVVLSRYKIDFEL
jgi:hypothetical protein